MRFVVVTGTGTGVGKTVVTAVLARVALATGMDVGVVKPTQTGISTGEPSDVSVVTTLSGCTRTRELVRLGDPLSPDSAARHRGISIPSVRDLAEGCADFGAEAAYPTRSVVVVEGAGGVLVRLDTAGGTVLDLASALTDRGDDVRVVVVTGLRLGTLNHTELTIRAIEAQGLEVSGLVLGAVPADADEDLACRLNRGDLPRVTGAPVLGGVPQGAGSWSADRFRRECGGWIDTVGLFGQR